MVAEAVVVRNYLDWLLSLPWSVETKDRLDLKVAEQILEEDLWFENPRREYWNIWLHCKLAKKDERPILCLVGLSGSRQNLTG